MFQKLHTSYFVPLVKLCIQNYPFITGNSSSAILDGVATVSLLKLGEDYTVTMPYAHVKGITYQNVAFQ